jgi:uracil-DNA glycosylase
MTAGLSGRQPPHAEIAVQPSPVALQALLQRVRGCTLCAAHLPHAPRPVLQADGRARILIAGQAPGRRVHASGVPFDDASGERLRDWMGIGRDVFYDASRIALVPMGLCYPGKGDSGDLPPRRECAVAWRAPLLAQLPRIELTLAVGAYALTWHGARAPGVSLTDAVRGWPSAWARGVVPLPHPSPRNNGWLKHNPWFAKELLPALRERVAALLALG